MVSIIIIGLYKHETLCKRATISTVLGKKSGMECTSGAVVIGNAWMRSLARGQNGLARCAHLH